MPAFESSALWIVASWSRSWLMRLSTSLFAFWPSSVSGAPAASRSVPSLSVALPTSSTADWRSSFVVARPASVTVCTVLCVSVSQVLKLEQTSFA